MIATISLTVFHKCLNTHLYVGSVEGGITSLCNWKMSESEGEGGRTRSEKVVNKSEKFAVGKLKGNTLQISLELGFV